MIVRTRFAPSPTGYLHVGGARTALYSYLYAKKNNGKFILRIEDTDRERSTEEAVEAIIEGMQWLGLHWDEGPFFQTARMERYQQIMQQMLETGTAYRCYCSKERLETLRETQLANKEKPRYDGHCRNLNHEAKSGESFVVRFKNPLEGEVRIDDQVLGLVTFQNSELDDLIIARSDGMPTYNFTVVVDDFDMNITHVIRGNDHLNNTPRQINLLRALNATPPIYAHIPMILGDDGKRLSKRHGADSVLNYRNEGYLPEALVNYLVRLGWSYGDQEIFSLEEMVKYFDANALSKSPAAFNTEKLQWLNQHYMKTLDVNYVAEQLQWQMQHLQIDTQQGPALTDVVIALRERSKTLKEMAEKSRCFYQEIVYDMDAVKAHLIPEIKQPLMALKNALDELTVWDEKNIHESLVKVAEQFSLKLGKIAQPVRVAATGSTVSPSIDVTLKLLGKKTTLERLEQAANQINE